MSDRKIVKKLIVFDIALVGDKNAFQSRKFYPLVHDGGMSRLNTSKKVTLLICYCYQDL